MKFLQQGRITLKGELAQKYRLVPTKHFNRLPNNEWGKIKAIERMEAQTERQVTKRVRPLWQTIELLEQHVERTITQARQRVVPVRKGWRPYLQNKWRLAGYNFRVVLSVYKTGTPMKEVQFIARMLLELERGARRRREKRPKYAERRLSEREFKRQLANNAYLFNVAYTNSELNGVLASGN